MIKMRAQRRFTILTVGFLLLILSLWTSMALKSYGAVKDIPDNERVFDQAGILTPAEITSLEESVAQLRDKMNMDLVIATVGIIGSHSTESYADNFYENGGFGRGKDHSGAIFLIDMENREVYISTEGAMIRFLTDKRIEQMLDHAYIYLQNGNYSGAFNIMITDLEKFYEKGIPNGQYSYDRETGEVSIHRSIKWYEFLIAFAISVFSGVSACLGVKNQYTMKVSKRQMENYLMAYRADAAFQFHARADELIDKSVTHRVISSSSGGGRSGGFSGGSSSGRSTTHRSSSGRSHGGGGRKF